jgi:hypothetical protein
MLKNSILSEGLICLINLRRDFAPDLHHDRAVSVRHRRGSDRRAFQSAGDLKWLDPEGIPTIGDWFRAVGYKTHYFGKWHVSDPAAIWSETTLYSMAGIRHLMEMVINTAPEASSKCQRKMSYFTLSGQKKGKTLLLSPHYPNGG